MRRIRIVLALVSLATLCLVTLLAWRANEGLLAERTRRHEAVAQRTFEEMERALTAFLAREEARPFEHYAHTLPASGERSPLAAGLEPFVVGAFQLDPGGAVSTPLEPSGGSDADDAEHDVASSEDVDRQSARRVRRAVNGLWSSNGAGAPARADAKLAKGEGAREARPGRDAALDRDTSQRRTAPTKEALTQAPGTTRVVAGPGVDPGDEGLEEAVTVGELESRNAYDVLGRLNRVAEDRAERKQKVARAPKATVYGDLPQEARVASQTPGTSRGWAAEAPAESEPRPAVVRESFTASAGAPAQSAPAPSAATSLAGAAEAPSSLADSAGAQASNAIEAVRVAIDPMVGVASGDDLVLYRTVLVDRSGYRQGLVLDREALGAWLEDRVIRASGLSRVVRASFGEIPVSAPGDEFVFVHRFAEPFDALHATLTLTPLPGVASPAALYALVGVLLVVGAAGLLAVHQMVSVTVGYAERRSNFVAAVSHELKTPLTAIRMYSEMLRDGLVSGDEKRHEYYATITDESERLSRLVDNVLEFSRLEGGRRELAPVVGAVAPVLEEAVEKLSAHATRDGFELALDVAPGLPAVRFDRDALLQVLFNLVDNAMKYARDSDPKRIELLARRDGGDVVVSVRDFGPGVARAHQGRIFEPFYRGESELTRTTKGTGIGLALVKELAERMGASVAGANVDGGGFRVSLAFPTPSG